MVGGEAVNHIQIFPQAIHILLRCQSRADFAASGCETCQVFIQKQMMRANFAGHFDSTFLCGFDQQDFLFQRNMGNMYRTVINGGEQNRGSHASAFAMRHDRHILRIVLEMRHPERHVIQPQFAEG